MPKKEKKVRGELDFSKYPTRKVALRIAYHGQEFDGLAVQENTPNTVEQALLEALLRARLVPPLEEGATMPANWARCGRTDKGVSALGNAVSLTVRAAQPGKPDFEYGKFLNRCLPLTVRVVAWAFVEDRFDARFSCRSRTYRYFFRSEGRDVAKMREAAALLEGSHDFRHFCKMDVVNVDNFVRNIKLARIVTLGDPTGLGLSYLEIRGNAFLYHQIRCIVAVLFLVGGGHEEPSIVSTMLDVDTLPAKPGFQMAEEFPLVLWDCWFDGAVTWHVDAGAVGLMCRELMDRATDAAVRAAIAREMCNSVLEQFGVDGDHETAHEMGEKGRHIPLLERPRENTYDEKVAALSDKKKRRREDNRSHTTSGHDRARGIVDESAVSSP